MKNIVLIVGGARSGKSTYAVQLAKKSKQKVIFIATCTFKDEEMEGRIKQHRLSRPSSWKVIVEGKNIAAVLQKMNSSKHALVVDCLGLWVSNLLEDKLTDRQIEQEFKKLASVLDKAKGTVILVSNEVGCGLVPAYFLGRRFRDLLGRANQIIAKKADEVFLMQIGFPTQLKVRKAEK